MAFPGAPGFIPPGMNQWGRGMPPQMGPMGQMGPPGMGMMPRGMPPRGPVMPMGPMAMGFRGPGFMQPNMNLAAANAMAHANTTAASIMGGAMPPQPSRPTPGRTSAATLPEGEQVIENWARVHNPKLLPPGPPAKPPKNSQKRTLIEKLAKQCALSEANLTKSGKGQGCEALIKAVLKKQPQNTNFNFLRAGIDAEGRDYFRWVLYAKIKELSETQMDYLYRLHCQALASVDDTVDVPPCPAGLVPESARPAGSFTASSSSSLSPEELLRLHQAAEEAKRKATDQKIQKYEAPAAEKEPEKKPAEPEEPLVNPMEALTRAMAYAQSTAPQPKKEPVPLAPPLPVESTLPSTPTATFAPKGTLPPASPAKAEESPAAPVAPAPPQGPAPPGGAPTTPTSAATAPPPSAPSPSPAVTTVKAPLPSPPVPVPAPAPKPEPKDFKSAEMDFYAMLETKEEEKPMPPAKRRKKK